MRKEVSITIEEDLLRWVDYQAKSVEYSSKSHVIEVAISQLREKSYNESVQNIGAANLKSCLSCENLFPGTLAECPRCGSTEHKS